MIFIENKHINIDEIYTEMEKQFPDTELKTKASLKKIFSLNEYKFFNIINEDNNICGYFTLLELPNNTALIDYFAINKEFHSKGYGTKTFVNIKQKLNYRGYYLEVEKENPQDINTIRRVKFYKNLGAQILDINYLYPNKQGNLPMDLYFMPQKGMLLPPKTDILANIKFIFDKLHFDIDNAKDTYEKIAESICNA